MAEQPSVEYVDRRMNQLGAACDAGDAEIVTGVLAQIRRDGHPEMAEALRSGMDWLAARKVLAA